MIPVMVARDSVTAEQGIFVSPPFSPLFFPSILLPRLHSRLLLRSRYTAPPLPATIFRNRYNQVGRTSFVHEIIEHPRWKPATKQVTKSFLRYSVRSTKIPPWCNDTDVSRRFLIRSVRFDGGLVTKNDLGNDINGYYCSTMIISPLEQQVPSVWILVDRRWRRPSGCTILRDTHYHHSLLRH